MSSSLELIKSVWLNWIFLHKLNWYHIAGRIRILTWRIVIIIFSLAISISNLTKFKRFLSSSRPAHTVIINLLESI